LDLAQRIAPGRVVGIDLSPDVIATARANQESSGETSVVFDVGSAYDLNFADSSFDVVYAHQVLQHLHAPVAALEQMRRVLRVGGLLAIRDSDYGAFTWAPEDPRLDRWMQIYQQLSKRNGANANAGRLLPTWIGQAGFESMDVSSSTWTFHQPDERLWWGQLWADRVRMSEFARQSLEYELTTQQELNDIADAFLAWAAKDDGLFIVVHVDVIARR
jgi:SAM-dependent methyltransferase